MNSQAYKILKYILIANILSLIVGTVLGILFTPIHGIISFGISLLPISMALIKYEGKFSKKEK